MKLARSTPRFASRLTPWIGLGILLAATAALSTGAAAAQWEHTRQGWTLSLGVGGGSAGLSPDSGPAPDRQGGPGGSFTLGYVFTPKVAAGLLTSGWTKEEGGATTSFSVGTLGVTFYPDAAGFYARAGVGVGSSRSEVTIGNITTSVNDEGFGFTAGAGYEWRLARRFALGPEAHFGWASLDGGSANYINGVLQATWYFLPRQ